MADPMFRAFLVAQAETLRNELTDGSLAVSVILEKAKQINRLESRVQRMDNPISRTRKPVEAVV